MRRPILNVLAFFVICIVAGFAAGVASAQQTCWNHLGKNVAGATYACPPTPAGGYAYRTGPVYRYGYHYNPAAVITGEIIGSALANAIAPRPTVVVVEQNSPPPAVVYTNDDASDEAALQTESDWYLFGQNQPFCETIVAGRCIRVVQAARIYRNRVTNQMRAFDTN